MLRFNIFFFSFFKFVQNGLYFDFFFKKLIEIFVRNYFVLTSNFFGEKFLIEFLTKKTVDSFVYNQNRFLGFFELFYSYYFIQILIVFFFSMSYFAFVHM